MCILSAAGPLRVGELAARTGVTFPTMSRVLNKVIQHGWAQRHVAQTDRRASVIAITGTGEAVLDAGRHDRTTRLAAALARLAPDDTTALLAAMPALETLADQIAGARQK